MSYSRTLLRIALTAIATLQLAACSKTVQWEEEVTLNTGETIWVKRTVNYTLKGGAGNPLDRRYRRDMDEAIEFTWKGKNYLYKGTATINVLAISPSKRPILVAPAEGNSWNLRNNYPCTIPYYVQLEPDDSGHAWMWQPQIESWLFNLPTNLFRDFGTPEGILPRYTAQQKRLQPYLVDPQSAYLQRIDPAFVGDLCMQKMK